MTRRTLFLIAALVLVPVIRLLPTPPTAEMPASTLPQRLSGAEFWKLSMELSEPDGFFRSDNLVSNELFMQRVIPDLMHLARPGRAYLGVGPEQNFTYIAALKPSIAFIIDIRRGNLRLHLMYRAIFELSSNRAEFVSRLFSMKPSANIPKNASVEQLFAAFEDPEQRSDELYKQNVGAIRELFVKKLKMGLPEEDLQGIADLYQEFYTRGVNIHYEITPGSNGAFPTYGDLMKATDHNGVARSFLASEENFAVVKDLESRNLVVPVVGNFGGPKAIRAVGRYLRGHDAIVSAFYVSNVEQYLGRDGGLDEFCASSAALPLDDASTYIRSERGGMGPRGFRGPGGFADFSSQLHNIRNDVKNCTAVSK